MKLNKGYRSVPKGGPLGYAKKGQVTVRPQAHRGKPPMSRPTGIYHGSNKGK